MTRSPGTGVLSSRGAKATAALAAAAALSVGGVLGILARPDHTTKVVLEPIAKVARDSWIPHGIDPASGSEAEIARQYARYHAGSDVPDSREDQVSATLAGTTVDGDSAGVYAGSRDTQACDKAALTAYLTAEDHADVARLWAGVLQIDPAQVTNYISGLTGGRLRWDTRVTDSGLRDGRTTQWQALLQAGTAVLVDNTGVPRVKCSSGSPLLAPAGVRSASHDDLSLHALAENPGDAWAHLDTSHAVSIAPGEQPLTNLVIVDVDSDDLLQRDVGSDGASTRDVGSGDVQFNLRWTSRADLDIHVVDPEGNSYGYEDGYYQGSTSPNGGQQDVDSNIGCQDERDDSGFAKENVFWPPGNGPSGTYEVHVTGFQVSSCSPAQSGSFTLTATIGGQVQSFNGVVTEKGDSQTWTFTKP
ncbi:DUF6777 domain-containing protein [Nocardioides montaniterrae]